VAVEVDRVPDVGARQELRLADLAGPAAAKLRGRHVAALDDADRVEELRCEELGAAAVIGERCERTDDREFARGIGTEVSLEAPDRNDDLARHAALPLDAVESRFVSGETLARAAHEGAANATRVELLEAQLERAL